MKAKDPFLLALLEGGKVELHELPPRPPAPTEAPRQNDCCLTPIDYQINYDPKDWQD